jgi:hypothetical protein
MRFVILILMLIAIPGAARADMTALYRQIDGDRTIKVEIADNGDARFAMSDEPWELIYAGGVSYVVYSLPKGLLAARVSDMQQLAADRGEPAPRLGIATMPIAEQREAAVDGYAGIGYHLRTPYGVAPRPQIVMSRDPSLAPLGPAWLRQIDFSIAMLRSRGAAVPETILAFRDILSRGAPILYGGHRLESVDRTAVPPQRFQLPVKPMSLKQLRRGEARALFGGS